MGSEDEHLEPILALLTDALEKKYTAQIKQFRLRHIEINHCIGCFNCWVKTPGKCIYNDGGAAVLQDILRCDILVLFTPVVFGSYSSELKKILDRFLPILLPFFQKIYNETHHVARYSFFPRLIGIGVQASPDQETSDCFKVLIGRNAINFHSLSYAAGVIDSTAPEQDTVSFLKNLLSIADRFPDKKSIYSLPRKADHSQSMTGLPEHPNALLLIGSPKRKNSTSSILGNSLLKKLEQHGWGIEALTIHPNIFRRNAIKNFIATVSEANMIIITCPLYCDTLPYLTTKIFELIEQRKDELTEREQKRLVAIVNNGFPETYQNFLSLSVCRNFAHKCDMIWAGGLALGAGEGLLSGQPITGFKGYKSILRPPLYNVEQALSLMAASISHGHPVPGRAVQLMAKKPIPFISFNLWRYIYTQFVKRIAKREVRENGLDEKTLYDKPYQD